MILKAFGKINLGLRILRKRDDGYHDIETVFHLINCFDEIELKKRKDGKIIVASDNVEVPTDAANLCVKAATSLQDLTGARKGVEIHLKKGIPVGAGLGGGSTDAASVVKGLVDLWDLDVSLDDLNSILEKIGSDATFFLNGRSAFATGRGEILEPLELSFPYWIVVVTPPIHVSTAWAYKNYHSPRIASPNGSLRHALLEYLHDEHHLNKALVNDFEPLVFQNYPEIAELKKQFFEVGANFALMSGSGSSVYGLFLDGAQAQSFAASFEPPYRVSLTEPFFKPEPDHFLTKH